MTKDEALRMALEALENHSGNYKLTKDECVKYRAIEDSIKEALSSPNGEAQPEPWEKFCDSNCVWTDHHPDCKLAQPEKDIPKIGCVNHDCNKCKAQPEQDGQCKRCTDGCPACDARRLPEQEPVAWLITDEKINSLQVNSIQRLIDRARHAHMTDIKLRINGQDEWFQADWLKHLTRTTPPQRTWVGLTDEEIDQGLLRSDYALKTAEAWRAGVVFAMTKLKEKNT